MGVKREFPGGRVTASELKHVLNSLGENAEALEFDRFTFARSLPLPTHKRRQLN